MTGAGDGGVRDDGVRDDGAGDEGVRDDGAEDGGAGDGGAEDDVNAAGADQPEDVQEAAATQAPPQQFDAPPPYGQQPDLRFHLPPGQPVRSSGWRRRYRWHIRIGSIAAAVLLVIAALVAMGVGAYERMYFTASGAVTVDCATQQGIGTVPVRFGDPVSIYDAQTRGGAPLARTRLDELRALGGGTCLARFEVHDLKTVDAYVVMIGDGYRRLVTAPALAAGYVFE